MIPFCKACCSCCDDCCGCDCDCECKCLEDSCPCLKEFLTKPFSCWAICFLFFLGGPGLVCIIFGISTLSPEECVYRHDLGLIILGICFMIHIPMNFYIVSKYSKEYGTEFDQKRGEKSICEVTWKFLCYDIPMCLFLIFLGFSMAWACVVLSWVGNEIGEDSECGDENPNLLYGAEAFGIAYLVYFWVSILVFFCKICCLCMEEDAGAKKLCCILTCGLCFDSPPIKRQKPRDQNENKKSKKEKKKRESPRSQPINQPPMHQPQYYPHQQPILQGQPQPQPYYQNPQPNLPEYPQNYQAAPPYQHGQQPPQFYAQNNIPQEVDDKKGKKKKKGFVGGMIDKIKSKLP